MLRRVGSSLIVLSNEHRREDDEEAEVGALRRQVGVQGLFSAGDFLVVKKGGKMVMHVKKWRGGTTG